MKINCFILPNERETRMFWFFLKDFLIHVTQFSHSTNKCLMDFPIGILSEMDFESEALERRSRRYSNRPHVHVTQLDSLEISWIYASLSCDRVALKISSARLSSLSFVVYSLVFQQVVFWGDRLLLFLFPLSFVVCCFPRSDAFYSVSRNIILTISVRIEEKIIFPLLVFISQKN